MRKKSTAAEDKNYDLSKFSQKKENKNLYFKSAVRTNDNCMKFGIIHVP